MHVQKGMHACVSDLDATPLVQRPHDTEGLQRLDQDRTLGKHLVAEGEVIGAVNHHLPPRFWREMVIDRFHFGPYKGRFLPRLLSVIAEDKEEWLMQAFLDDAAKRYPVDVDSNFALCVVVAELRCRGASKRVSDNANPLGIDVPQVCQRVEVIALLACRYFALSPCGRGHDGVATNANG